MRFQAVKYKKGPRDAIVCSCYPTIELLKGVQIYRNFRGIVKLILHNLAIINAIAKMCINVNK